MTTVRNCMIMFICAYIIGTVVRHDVEQKILPGIQTLFSAVL